MVDLQLQAQGQRRWWALGALAISVLVVGLDLFVLSLALPTLAVKLHASTGDLQWFVDAYSLVLAAALLPAGLLGDRLGRKRLLMCALGVFGIASLACSYSTSTGELIAARAVLGLAAAVILPLALAVLPVMFTAEERPKAIGIVGGATFLGYPLGPILGGWLLDHYWWGSVFLINVPIAAIALVTVMFLMPESKGSGRFRIDFTGVLISSVGLAVLTYGVIRAGQDGWSDTVAIATMLAGAAALAFFVPWERLVRRRGRQPLVDLSLFSSGGFTWGTTLSTMISFALFGLTFAMPQFFLDVKGLDSLASGIRMLPLIGGLAVGLALGQRLQSPRSQGGVTKPPLVGVRPIGAGGFAIMAAALAVGTATSAASGTGFTSAWFAVTGFGLGLAMPTMLNAALSALSPERSGSGSALMTAARQVGATIGVAVLGTVLNSVYRGHLGMAALPPAVAAVAKSSVGTGVAVAAKLGSASVLSAVHAAYASGVDVMLWVCAAIAIAAAVLAALFLPRQPTGPTHAPAAGAGGEALPGDTPANVIS
ncbi:MAG TPA: DHA2 family efflux MFS transporter permease subunit [Streptosporangiaceae bacterium]|nr:DHA2 family efflux MFS transporter permease subunit [Streptosporangiaceae bacterium]